MSDPKPGSWQVQQFNSQPDLPTLCPLPEWGTASGSVWLTPFAAPLLEKVAWRARCVAVPAPPCVIPFAASLGTKAGRSQGEPEGQGCFGGASLFAVFILQVLSVCWRWLAGPPEDRAGSPGPCAPELFLFACRAG